MLLNVLKSKIHRATVTGSDLHSEGSCSIDGELMDAVGIVEFERVEIYNLNNGERFSTYAMRAPEASGQVQINGAAARLAHTEDQLIICAYALITEDKIGKHQPAVVQVDPENKISNFSS